uniref:Uncharacterized protein n=1 Tax=Anguilla anguilla TaxID=7936 RepID=A0A0E9QXM1_ANGAN
MKMTKFLYCLFVIGLLKTKLLAFHYRKLHFSQS